MQTDRPGPRKLRSFWWLALLLLPIGELIANAIVARRVVPDAEYASAARLIRSQLGARDLITSAPLWTDPILRLHLGNQIPLAMAGRSDDASYERMWVLSVNGALPKDAPAHAPTFTQDFGHVRVLRYDLGKSPVLFDFASAITQAHVSLERRGRVHDCELHRDGFPRGGGLGRGVLTPIPERFDCDARKPWLMVGPVVMEDLDIEPRYCIWQHAQGDDPVTVTFSNVPLADSLVFYAGLYYEHERMRQGGPVRADIYIDGQQRASMTHVDGDGWKRLEITTPPSAANASNGASPRSAEVRIEVRAHAPDQRSFCWSATTRSTVKVGGVPRVDPMIGVHQHTPLAAPVVASKDGP